MNQSPEEHLTEGTDAFPTAVVKEQSKAMLANSRFWWLALACLLISIGLVFWSMPSGGTHIQIHFPQGHGLKAEDPVRYRGIDVGVVETIHLTDGLEAVDVHVKLFPTAKQLATEGSKFWIVRPQLSISGVSGLDTAVGHKYIQVQPGTTDQATMRYFDGLASEPVDQGAGSGIEILLQADARHSVNVGSSIHFRGVAIGRILSVELSPDARLVEVRGKIEEAYRSLVTTEAKFWATGGVDFDFSFTKGLKLDTESLDTLARGGVSMLVTGNGGPVSPGYVFPLAASPEADWITQANNFRATSADLRGAINLTASWTQSGMLGLGKRDRTEQFTGVGINTSSGPKIIYPADVASSAESALDDSFKINIAGTDATLPTTAAEGAPIITANLPAELASDLIAQSDISKTLEPVNWIAVRKSIDSDVFHHLPIEAGNIKLVQAEDGGAHHWIISEFTGDRAVWHGTPVLQSSTSNLVGILLIDDLGTTVQPVSESVRTVP